MIRTSHILLLLALTSVLFARGEPATEEPTKLASQNFPPDYYKRLAHHFFPKEAEAIVRGETLLALLDKKWELKSGLYLPDELQAYIGKRIVLIGGVAPPGGSNDLVTENRVYLRIINTPQQDWRPHSAVWEVAVCGTIQGIIPENRIIVIEVKKKDWKVLQTL